jgi:hypothetical protein
MSARTTSARPDTADATVLVTGPDGLGLRALPRSRWHSLWARVRSDSLDEQLAAGAAPERDLLLAVRAGDLVGPAERAEIALRWEELVARARRPRPLVRGQVRVPIARPTVLAATDSIHDLVTALRAARPLAAAGVARASLLLTSGRSPVYTGLGDLRGQLARALADLDAAGPGLG